MENFIRLNSEEFRRKLAFPLGSDAVSDDAADKAKSWLVDLCSILPKFYSDALDRTNLWGRISQASVRRKARSASGASECSVLRLKIHSPRSHI